MPRKYNRRSRRPRRQGTNYIGLAKKAFSLAKWVAGLINVEKKTNQISFSSVGVTQTSAIYPLTLMSTGTSDITRNGNSIKAASNLFKYTLQLPAAATVGCAVRFLVFIDKVSNGVTPISSDIFDNGITGDILAPYNRDNAGSRFRILKDVKLRLERNGRDHLIGSIYTKLHHHVKFDDTTGVIASATTGHVYLLMVSDGTGTGVPTLEAFNTFSFIDN